MCQVNQPMFSIVVPTRMRESTLPHTLATILSQDSADFEIVVADNASTPLTRKIVEGLDSDRIRYVRSDTPLAMTDNWNAALEQATGEWVMYIGDDDALCPGALAELAQAIEQYQVRAIRWNWATYTWPDVQLKDQANRLVLPIFRRSQVLSSQDQIIAIAENTAGYHIPHSYHSLIHRSLLDEALATGSVFDGPVPDIFSGVLFASLDDTFLELASPMTVLGLSGRSNSVAYRSDQDRHGTLSDFMELNQLAKKHLHPNLPQEIFLCSGNWDALFRVRDRLSLADPRLRVSPDVIAQACLDSIWVQEPQRSVQIEKVLEYFRQYGGESGQQLVVPAQEVNPGPPSLLPYDGKLGITESVLTVDASTFGVTNVAEAADLVQQLRHMGPLFDLIRGEMLSSAAQRERLSEREWTASVLLAERDEARNRLAALGQSI